MEQGTAGQVILCWHDSDERTLLAPSWGDYLERVAQTMEAGRIKYDEDYGLIVSAG